eukprot:scaffold14126_cov73-Skeletonema_marinoi.AAC.3
MSEDNAVDTSSCCASCGIAEVDDIKLKECADCDLVRYCSDECQKNHRSQHEEACNKRAAELRDKLLFKQLESSYRGDCPICMIPMPLDPMKSVMMMCCSKLICQGCHHANQIREADASLQQRCPFCRKALVFTDEERNKQKKKRIEANDPVAMTQWGKKQYVKGNYSSAFEYFTRAAELGDVLAHYQLALMHHYGDGVEKDKGKEMYHLEEAAIGGHPYARYNIGWNESKNGNDERAAKHWIIAASQGDDSSMKALIAAYKGGLINKEDLAAALRAHQAAVDATKSPQREAAEEYRQMMSSAD